MSRQQDALEDAQVWGRECQALCGKKGQLETVAKICLRDPPPAQVYGLKKLRDAVRSARELTPKLEEMSRKLQDPANGPVLLDELQEVGSMAEPACLCTARSGF